MSHAQHIVNVSGGKDSASCYMLAIMRGVPFRAVAANTDHENDLTWEWIERLPERTGGPVVEVVKADFTDRIARKRQYVQEHWPRKGVPDEVIQAALDVLHPTGNAFLDMCIWKGRFPSLKGQFCTGHLKAEPIFEQVFAPALEHGPLVSWQGERRAESPNRANLPRFNRVRHNGDLAHLADLLVFRPILHWSAENTFALHKHFGLEPNPLYTMGMGRVGCFPCINASKAELAEIFRRFPDVLEKLRRYERIVGMASKRGQATFYSATLTPQGRALVAAQKQGLRLDEPLPGIDEAALWCRTSRGGKQFDIFKASDSPSLCSSQYGLCE